MKTWQQAFLLFIIVILAVMVTLLALTFNCLQAPAPRFKSMKEAVDTYKLNRQVYQPVPITVSLTTLPSRLHNGSAQATIYSLLNQRPPPQEIFFNIPFKLSRKNTPYVIPAWLKEEGLSQIVKIRRGLDYGPATKYYKTLKYYEKRNPNRLILIIDDDIIFEQGSMAKIYKLAQKYPDKVITGHATNLTHKNDPQRIRLNYHKFVIAHPNFLQFMTAGKGKCLDKKEDFRSVDTVMGYKSYLLRPKFLGPNIDDLVDWSTLPKEAFFVDDIVMSGYLARNKVDRIVAKGWPELRMSTACFGDFVRSLIIPTQKDESLSATSNKNNEIPTARSNNTVTARFFIDDW